MSVVTWLLEHGRIVWIAVAVLGLEYVLLRNRVDDSSYVWTTLSGLGLMIALYAGLTGRGLLVVVALTAGFIAHCLEIRQRLRR
jgi:hypothetical protein